MPRCQLLPSGELTVCYGKSPFLMGKSTISMAIFNCYVSSPEGKSLLEKLTASTTSGMATAPVGLSDGKGDASGTVSPAGFDCVDRVVCVWWFHWVHLRKNVG